LLSITKRSGDQRGQVLPLFAGALLMIIAIAALVFDVGQNLLDRRTEQNAADAAALAGARYLTEPTCASSPSVGNCANAYNAAIAMATNNGFTDGVNNATVIVHIPPGPESVFSGYSGHISVQIRSTRPSFFSGVLGIVTQRTGALGVAVNSTGYALPHSLLALDPTSCGKNKITGTGGVTTNGTVHVDSNCSPDALLLSGNGVLNAPECDVVGTIKTSGGATNNCSSSPAGIQVSGDPLHALVPPTIPGLGSIVKEGSSKDVPTACPGGTSPPSLDEPKACVFGGSYAGDFYRMYPGLYPGGLKLNAGTFYMEPGIYYIAGGGLSLGGNGATVYSVEPGGTVPGGGILIYNTEDPTYHSECSANAGFPAGTIAAFPNVTGSVACYAGISFNGSSATINVKPIQTGIYKNMLIFVDRNLSYRTANPSSGGNDIVMNGSSTSLVFSGTIYDAAGMVQINGSGAMAISTQIIAYDFQVNGSGGQLTINYNPDDLFHLSGVGLVQ
jgi:hypothetical protein